MFKFLRAKLKNLFGKRLDEALLEKVEKLLYESDFGCELSETIVEYLRSKSDSIQTEDELFEEISILLKEILETSNPLIKRDHPDVYLFAGSNGSGKTTTVAKLAHHFHKENRRVLMVAADTFRAAAVEQLEIWSQKLGCPLIKGRAGGDSAAVACDGIKASLARGYDTVLIDTSGRLHSNYNLMQEFRKIVTVCRKSLSGGALKSVLTLDATLGSNTLEQVKFFHDIYPLTGLILTKTDGSAKGGTIFNIYKKFNIPTLYLGYGESIEDLKPFHAETFVNEILFP